jgi:hypothetical protein
MDPRPSGEPRGDKRGKAYLKPRRLAALSSDDTTRAFFGTVVAGAAISRELIGTDTCEMNAPHPPIRRGRSKEVDL